MGLESLIEITSELIPEGKQTALAASQKANLNYCGHNCTGRGLYSGIGGDFC